MVIVKWWPFEYKAKSGKSSLSFRSEIGVFDMLFKRLYEESFEDLQVCSNSKR